MSEDQRWALVGEAFVAICRRRRRHRIETQGLRRMPLLPGLLFAARWQSSPVGRFDEVTVLEPVLLGPRPGLAVTAHGVSVPAAAGAYRSEWGIPADPATIRWSTTSDGCAIHWEEEGLQIEVASGRVAVPLVLPLPLLHGGGPPFRVPQRVRGLGRRARVEVKATDGGCAWLSGEHAGVLLRSARFAMLARRISPTAALQSLRLPLSGPEPAAGGNLRGVDARSERLQSVDAAAGGNPHLPLVARALSSVG